MTWLKKNVALWLRGLAAAVIGGAASAMDSGMALMVIDPKDFNFADARKLMMAVLTIGCLTGLKCAFAYLKQSPVPKEEGGQ